MQLSADLGSVRRFQEVSGALRHWRTAPVTAWTCQTLPPDSGCPAALCAWGVLRGATPEARQPEPGTRIQD
eukprot:14773769-Alexandrium_andersonii.AAC.1